MSNPNFNQILQDLDDATALMQAASKRLAQQNEVINQLLKFQDQLIKVFDREREINDKSEAPRQKRIAGMSHRRTQSL